MVQSQPVKQEVNHCQCSLKKQELFLYRASRLSAKPELRRQRRLRIQQDEGAVRLRL